MKIEMYDTLENKSKYFNTRETINTILDFEKKVIPFFSYNNCIFRGVSEAKYKMYTSAQREYKKCDYSVMGVSYKEFLQRILSNIKENEFLSNFFEKIKIRTNDIFYFSLLQHYKMPTPLIDFTHDLETALYFAINASKNSLSANQIDNYFSIYCLQLTSQLNDWYNLGNALKIYAIGDSEKYLKDSVSWEKLKDISVSVIDNTNYENDKDGYVNYLNLNLMAQKGCFIFYTLEESSLESKLIEMFFKPFYCFDIHKSLIEAIRCKYCKKTGIDLFPSLGDICADAYNQFKLTLK